MSRGSQITLEEYLENVSPDLQDLYSQVERMIRPLSRSVFHKVSPTAISYYSPDRCLVYLESRSDWLRVSLYAGDRDLPEADEHIMKGNSRVGIIRFRKAAQSERLRSSIAQAFQRASESTG